MNQNSNKQFLAHYNINNILFLFSISEILFSCYVVYLSFDISIYMGILLSAILLIIILYMIKAIKEKEFFIKGLNINKDAIIIHFKGKSYNINSNQIHKIMILYSRIYHSEKVTITFNPGLKKEKLSLLLFVFDDGLVIRNNINYFSQIHNLKYLDYN